MRSHVTQVAIGLSMLLTGALLASLLLSGVGAAEVGGIEQQVQPQTVRSSFTLPKLFDFEHFKSLFKKSYRSFTESLARKRLYLARALKVFLSAISYKHRKRSSYLSINHMSDWTEEEVAKTHLGRQVLEEMEGHRIEATASGEDELVDEADLEQRFAEILQNENNKPGYKEIAEELRQQQQQMRKRREISDLRDLPVVSLIGNPEERFERSDRIKSNNKDYVQVELTSFGSDRYGADTKFKPSFGNYTKTLKSPGFIVSKIQDMSELLKQPIKRNADLSVDEVYFDHRDSNCLFAPRRQRDCGSCYAFAAISLYEWNYCIATHGKKVALSEQYIVDCGDRSGMNGCNGAHFVRLSHFANTYGLELRQHYPYRATEDTCPYEASASPQSMGYLRTKDGGFYYISVDRFEELLPLSPMMIGVRVNPEFQSYGGGVDEPANCDPKSGHAMLLIGHGREDGEEYWLIRNSYGVDWGVGGHYKMSKKFDKCIMEKYAYMLRSFEVTEGPDGRPVSQEVTDRYTAYMMKDGEGKLQDTLQPKAGSVVQSAKLNTNRV